MAGRDRGTADDRLAPGDDDAGGGDAHPWPDPWRARVAWAPRRRWRRTCSTDGVEVWRLVGANLFRRLRATSSGSRVSCAVSGHIATRGTHARRTRPDGRTLEPAAPRPRKNFDRLQKTAALVVAARVVATRAMPEGPYPELAVFDLDACFWDEEMYTLRDIVDPARSVRGTSAMASARASCPP